MCSYCNSLTLNNILLKYKTHATEILRKNRKENLKYINDKNLKKVYGDIKIVYM
jgi:hypothetical protein